MDDQTKILSYLRITGPVLPAQVAKNIHTNILLASAHLSELSSRGKLKVSNIKIGGSPLYFLPEHNSKLQDFIENLKPQDQRTLKNLKEAQILREKNLDLLTRVSLRNIKDFAIPLNVTLNQQKEIFWKWYLLTDQQATDMIKQQLSPPPPEPVPQPQPVPEPEVIQEQPPPQSSFEPEPIPELVVEEKVLESHSLPEEKQTIPIEDKVSEKLEEENKPKKPLFQKLKEKIKPKRKEIPDHFFNQIEEFFKERNIEIDQRETVRKNSELNFILKVPSTMGKITAFCKAKNKKRCDEKDISTAYMESQTKKLPLFFLYPNEISKKAQELIDSGTFENLLIKKLI